MKNLIQDVLTALESLNYPKEVFTLTQLERYLQTLQEKYKNQLDINVIGYSRDRNPIHGIFLGDGDNAALWYGFPHANEPFGGTTILTLVKFLLEHPMGTILLKKWRWILVPCIDPDGALLNDPWI